MGEVTLSLRELDVRGTELNLVSNITERAEPIGVSVFGPF